MIRSAMLLLLISFVASAAEPKFHFQDCVVIVSGFYKNCFGRVQSVNSMISTTGKYDMYDVSLTCKEDERTLQSFREAEMKPSTLRCSQ